MRVLSLVPSATDWVAALGLGATLVGVTHECEPPSEADHPPAVVRPRIAVDHAAPAAIDAAVTAAAAGGVYELDVALVAELRPDVIVTQELCDVCAVPSSTVGQAAAAVGGGARVVNMTGTTLDGVLADGLALAAALGVPDRGRSVVDGLRARLQAVAASVGDGRPPVAFVEWPDPLWSAGHWVPDQIVAAGGDPVAGMAGEPSRRATAAEFAAADVVVVGPCGFGLDDAARAGERVTTLLGVDGAWAVDANHCFSRPAPTLVDGVEALAGILHPQRCAPPAQDLARRVVAAPVARVAR